MNISNSSSGSGPAPMGIGLSNTIHSEVAPCLPLPSLPVFCGASDPDLRLFDTWAAAGDRNLWSLDRNEILSQSARIADLLRNTDVSYLNLRHESRSIPCDYLEPLELHDQVLRCNPEAFQSVTSAFEYVTPGKYICCCLYVLFIYLVVSFTLARVSFRILNNKKNCDTFVSGFAILSDICE